MNLNPSSHDDLLMNRNSWRKQFFSLLRVIAETHLAPCQPAYWVDPVFLCAGDVPDAAHARHEIKGYINALTDLGVIALPVRRHLRAWYASGRPEQILRRSAVEETREVI